MLVSWAVNIILPILKRGDNLVLATVLSKSGSAPCLAGSKMAILADGSAHGTIGGGALEAEGLRQAADVFRTGVSGPFSFDLSGRDAASMSMICGGRVTVFLELIEANADNISVFEALDGALAGDDRCFTVSDLGEPGADIREITRCLVRRDGSFTGIFRHSRTLFAALEESASGSTYPVLTSLGNRRFLVERCYIPSTLFIFGAGHVSQYLARLTADLSFHTVVLDDRHEFANSNRFPTSDDVVVLESFEGCLGKLETDGDSYLVIVTRGHEHDRTVLEQALRTNAAYIGMLGSRKKIVEIRRDFLAKGFRQEDLDRVHCPIGVKIDAGTTAEIAVSIAAELIQVRARKTQ